MREAGEASWPFHQKLDCGLRKTDVTSREGCVTLSRTQ